MKNNYFIRQIMPTVIVYLIVISLAFLLSLLYHLKFSLAIDLVRFSCPFLIIYLINSFKYTRHRVHLLQQSQPFSPKTPVEYQLTVNYQTLSKTTQLQIHQLRHDEQEQLDHLELYAHEMKNSLAALQSQAADHNQLDRAFVLSAVHETNYYLDLILNEDRLSMGNNDFKFEWINLFKLVNEILKQDASIFISHQLTPETRNLENVQVLTDRKWLRFCLRQLFSNAIKYSTPGQKIEIVWQRNAILIKDFGSGITKHDLPRIYENGFTGENGHQTSHSTGMGLYLVKAVTQKLNFSVQITSEPDQGTTAQLIFSPNYINV
ncbi:ATPase/histidine kinase/DNA gyrase B/HSP90 domain protein [Limosilactobacillus coleohominis 101-4-CHN]|uniref:histidine kinase n=1 Tax=Limosilactobacillus coleohominis 101-4-CHN TaxID=575594 RepID=C7XTT8_9LACO|nr:sensor histidine kinase [Limosilactobacillus coleohominis]EEU30699.1 ATPase/histidine kinase/DNA gyrase B/HSP90 domain protein [Limosilactobacillus coleohominis 101-4-CHN]